MRLRRSAGGGETIFRGHGLGASIRFERGPMTRQNFPDLADLRFEVVQHDSGWAVWLITILLGILGVFALTALVVGLLIHG